VLDVDPARHRHRERADSRPITAQVPADENLPMIFIRNLAAAASAAPVEEFLRT
jgi:hypothetical protein